MLNRIPEQGKVMVRRFTNRMLESGLLILAVALGIGAASAGLALLAYTQEYGRKVLTSPAYREIVVSTHGEAEDMTAPVVEKPLQETTVLTQADLSARDLIPAVSYAYLAEQERLRFPDEGMESRMPMGGPPPEGDAGASADKAPSDGGEVRFARVMEALEEARGDGSIIIPEVDELSGWNVTPDFFLAWDMKPAAGSLFTEEDLLGTNAVIILGADTARLLAGEGEDSAALLGRKIFSFDGLTTVIGILEPQGNGYDGQFFTPAKDSAAAAGSQGGFRRPGMDSQLRFTVSDPTELDETSRLLSEWFGSQFGQGQIVVSNPRAEAERLIARNTGIGLLILFLSLAGLFIASVNVSHILMGRALRMRKHIGILKALGASRRKILHLFVAEALAVTLGGAALGALLAVPLSSAMQEALDLGTGSPVYLFLGVLISWILTLVFSLVPAWQGSRIEAAEAMRSA